MFKNILIKTGEKIMYGFGIGMGTAFKIISVNRNDKTLSK